MERRHIHKVNMLKRHALISRLRDIDVIGVRMLTQLLPDLLIPAPKGEVIIRTLHGFDLWIDPKIDRGVERRIYFTGTYEKGTLHVLSKLLRQGDTFVDIGANIGLMSIHASRLVGTSGKVIAFEPNPRTYEMLMFNIGLNNSKNVVVHRAAVGSRPEVSVIYDDPGSNRGRASLIKPEGASEGHKVEVVRFDELLKDQKMIRLVKLDIEGYELEALKGMEKSLRTLEKPMLMIECSSDRKNSHVQGTKAIFNFLESIGGYRYFMPSKGKERPSRLKELKGHSNFPDHDNVICLTQAHLDTIPREVLKD